jgi:hypothetical protein
MRRFPGFSRILDAVVAWEPNISLACPPAIVAARAALARTPPMRALRPQPLSARFMAVAAVTAATNAPLGAARAHTRKFSPQWILAVHASVPFVAMLRKALGMPPYAVLVTVLAAILGQAAGSRAETARCLAAARDAVAAADAADARKAAEAAAAGGWGSSLMRRLPGIRANNARCAPLMPAAAAPRGLAASR